MAYQKVRNGMVCCSAEHCLQRVISNTSTGKFTGQMELVS